MLRPILTFSVLFVFASQIFSPVSAQVGEERILDYASDITIRLDGSITVVETIRVHSQSQAIEHGIYRDFDFKGSVSVREVRHNGAPSPYHMKGKKLYIGTRIPTFLLVNTPTQFVT